MYHIYQVYAARHNIGIGRPQTMRGQFHSPYTQDTFSHTKSNHISMCKLLQNRKKFLILHILTQKITHISGCKIVHLCTIVTVTMHECTIIVSLTFIILHFFISPHLTLSFSASTLTSLSFISSPQSSLTNTISTERRRDDISA